MLSKHYFVALNSDDPDEYLPEGDCRNILNLIPKNEGGNQSPSKQTLKGTQNISISLPAGVNKCIGHAIDEKNDKILFFIHNDSGNGHIIAYWGENDLTANILIQSVNLFDFDTAFPINHAEVVDGTYLVWTDGDAQVKCITLRYDEVNSGYDMDFTDMQIMVNLQKVAPYRLPTTQMVKTANGDYNLISDINFQFAYRYVFWDNAISVFSPISDLNKAYLVPFSMRSAAYKELYNNGYRVYAGIYRKDIYKMIKSVEFAVRDGNYGQWRVFDTRNFTEPNPYGETTPANRNEITFITATFLNNSTEYYIPDSEAVKQFESIPRKSKALSVVDSRIILTENDTGFTFDNSYDLEINASSYNINVESTELKPPMFFKQGEIYGIGIAFSDGKQKSAVKSVVTHYVDREEAWTDFQIYPGTLKGIRATLSGNFPSWATDFQFYRTPAQQMDNYVQFPGRIMYYIAEFDPDNPPSGWSAADIAAYNPTVIDGRVYRKTQPLVAGDLFTYIHIQIPKNLPIQLDNSYFLRPLKTYKADLIDKNTTFQIIDVVGDKLVINKFTGIFPTTYAATFPNGVMFLEAFKPNISTSNNIFYACSDVYKTSEAQSTYDLWGDTHVIFASINLLKYIYNPLILEATYAWISYFFFSDVGNYGRDDQFYTTESPTPVFGSETVSTLQLIETTKKERKGSLVDRITEAYNVVLTGGEFDIHQITQRRWLPQSGFVLDYTKDDEAIGSPSVVNSNERQMDNSTVLRYSNKYVSDSLINGLSSFDATNKYVVKSEKGPIMALKLVDNVLLAIHPHTITSLYIGEAYLKQSDNEDIITKTESLIGAERTLGGNLGTIFPESIVTHSYIDLESGAKSTRLYGFDIYAGEPWRASNNGVIGLASNSKMLKWFREKSDEYLPWVTDHKSLINIISGYDPALKMYLITFPTVSLPAITGFAAKTVTGVTVGYSEVLNRWVSFYSFVPEHYVSFHNKLIALKAGQIWIHNQTEDYNKFYGTQYDALVTFLCNKDYSKDKIFRAVTQEASHAIKMELTYKDKYTYLNADELTQKGNDFIADLPMDSNSFVVNSVTSPTRIYGKPMIGKSMEVELTIPPSDELVQLTSVNLMYQQVRGSLNV